jgi:putative ABC transport system permease protein
MASIRLEETGQGESLSAIEDELEKLEPYMVFDYTYLEDTYALQYLKDEQTAGIVKNFAVIALLIACLGLYGLSSFMAVRKTREFGIRKIMGATVSSLSVLLIRQFTRWVLIAIAIASPLSWWVMTRWLRGFAYHTGVTVWILLAAAFLALLITMLTVLGQSLKTARTNPVDALRYE